MSKSKPTIRERAKQWFAVHDGMCVRSIEGGGYMTHLEDVLREVVKDEREAFRRWMLWDVETMAEYIAAREKEAERG